MQRIGRMGLLFALLPLVPLVALVALAPPATAQQVVTTSTAALAKLQIARAANPRSVAANRALGIWYYKANRFAEARAPLDLARQLDAKDGVSALYAGMAAEQMKDFTAAKSAYNSYLQVGKTSSGKKEIRARLVIVTKEEAKAAAKDAVAREAQIAQVRGTRNTVAVLPFKINLGDPQYDPLDRGLADMVITDLGKSGKLTVVERDRIQAIADEIALSRSGQVDAATTVRAGRLIQAGSIVQGSVLGTGGQNITMTSNVYSAETAGLVGQGANPNGTLDRLFQMEKALVKSVFTDLGVPLSPAELQEIDRTPTQSLAAFLAYSRGLEAQDNGRLDDAARFFDQARTADPGFGAALQRAQAAAAAQTSTTTKLESSIRNSAEGGVVAAAERGSTTTTGLNTTLNTVVGDVNPTTTNTMTTQSTTTGPPPTQQNTTAQATGTDQPAQRTGSVTIIIKKP